MKVIAALGDKQGTAAARGLAELLKTAKTTHILVEQGKMTRLSRERWGEDYVVVSSPRLSDLLRLKPDALIVGGDWAEKPAAGELPGVPVFLDGQDKKGAELVGCLKALGISCGNGEKNTVTIASMDESQVTIGLQRQLKTLQRTTIEQQDIPIKRIPDLDGFGHSAVVGAALVCGVELPN